jgi:hypothetical protein
MKEIPEKAEYARGAYSAGKKPGESREGRYPI